VGLSSVTVVNKNLASLESEPNIPVTINLTNPLSSSTPSMVTAILIESGTGSIMISLVCFCAKVVMGAKKITNITRIINNFMELLQQKSRIKIFFHF